MKHKPFLVQCLRSLWLLPLFFLGCGVPSQEIKIQLDQKALTLPETYHIWVLKDKLKNGTSVTCLGFLQGVIAFNSDQFDAEQNQSININGEQQEITLKKLSVGKKLFMVGGFAKDTKTPVALGCTEGDIKDGARLFLSIFLAQRS